MKHVHEFKVRGPTRVKDFCEPCIIGKMHRSPYNEKHERQGGILSQASADLGFPGSDKDKEPIVGRNGIIAYLGINIYHTQLRLVYGVKSKKEFKRKMMWVKRMLGGQVGTISSDQGGELSERSAEGTSWLEQACEEADILLEATCTEAHNQHGEIDGWVWTAMDAVRANLAETGAPRELWFDTLECEVQCWNW
ncbi:hypothetical protein HDU98_000103 [Podochytrium sp. JEL0797]|nr:hypothetical protein HDU98_000103 [Podochytrium sp. JEL0797]